MNSKECLERLLKYANINEVELITKYGYSALNDVETIKQDLERLEKLEKENKELRKSIKSWNENAGKLFKENINLKNVTEILKDKRVDVAVLLYLIECGNNTPQYYNKGLEEQYRLTQEEYELLKEVIYG